MSQSTQCPPTNRSSKNPITEMRNEPVIVIDDEGKVHNNLKHIVQSYIAKKLEYRKIG